MIENRTMSAPPPTIVDVYVAIRRWWWLLLLTLLVVSGAAVAVAYLLPPSYRSEVLLAPAESLDRSADGSIGGLSAIGALRSLAGPTSKGSAEALATLQSRRFTEEYIRRHMLMPELFADMRDPESGQWLVGEAPTLEDGVLRFASVRSVSVDDETGFVRLRVDWRSPVIAERWANALVRDLNNEMRERAIVEAQADLRFLQMRLGATQVPEIRTSLTGLIRERMETAMLAMNRPNYAFKVIDPATRSKYRYQPRRTLIVAGGAIAGLLLGFGLITIVETIRRIRFHV